MSEGEVNLARRRFLIGATSVVGGLGVVGAAVPFLASWQPSAKARALGAPTRVDIGKLGRGEMLGPLPEWRGKPIFVVNRTDENISVLVGICTHLGCSPKYYGEIEPQPFEADWKGGYFCPCHRSKFDLASRVYTGVPAPSNLEVPPYMFETDDVIIVGEDEETT
ncbi:MAG: ubiquinol-cytochrome c reductase iron-sulfur subunit [Thioalkalivibrio sp.]|nr:ubiquinol-cytochrome c reductase iron-sulfur subunit [Thioalkalivibrio sp.]